jgi:hypothetical protein
MRAVTPASYGATAQPPSQLSRPLVDSADQPSTSYPPLLALQSSPLPCRPSSTFIHPVPARSDESPVLPSRLPAPSRPRHNTLTKNAVTSISLSLRPSPLAQPCPIPILTSSRSFESRALRSIPVKFSHQTQLTSGYSHHESSRRRRGPTHLDELHK